ncbi:MAG: hypothetical protein ACREWG_08625, partial [Gammaproteobacteria bacterium]
AWINCRAAARQLIQAGAGALLSWGTAGALDPGLAPGALILASAVRIADIDLKVDPSWHTWLRERLSALRPHCGLLLHSPHALVDPVQKRDTYVASGALAVDMESGAVADVATAAGVPYAVIRAIVDRQSDAIPACAMQGLGEDGEPRIARTLCSLLRRPRELVPLLRLAGGFRRAGATLRAASLHAGTLYPV